MRYRGWWLVALLGLSVLVLAIEVVAILPRLSQVWIPFDYSLYLEMGNQVRLGQNPYGQYHYWPLPTVLWVFVPLSLMPSWFVYVWILGSLACVVFLFRRAGKLAALLTVCFTPLWYVLGDAMIDGWLLLPLLWLFENRPIWAGLGAALVLFKPQLAWLLVIYMFFFWINTRDWKNLGTFLGTMALFYIPSFIILPRWPLDMLAVLPERATYTTTQFPWVTGSIWAWWWSEGIGRWGFFILLIVAIGLSIRVFADSKKRAAGFLLLNFIFNPILFGGNMLMVAPLLKERKHIIISGLLSLGAFVATVTTNGFGGVFTLIPLAALYWQSRKPAENPAQHRVET